MRRTIFSKGNPVCEVRERINYKGRKFRTFGDYFNERKIYGIWRNFNGKDLKVASYHITYETLIRRILSNGFEIINSTISKFRGTNFVEIFAKKI